MRVAHWGLWAPNRSGMAETERELILAQRALGLDCGLIDAFDPDKSQTDGDFSTETFRYADGADLYCLHSHIPEYPGGWGLDGTPCVCFLHGMPRYSWETEVYMLEGGNSAPMATLAGYFNETDRFKRFFTMWPTQFATWEVCDNYRGRVRAAPNGVDLSRWKLDGEARALAGEPALLVADQARMCKDPFVMVFGAEWFRAKLCPEAQLHIVGFPPQGTGNRTRERWDHLIAQTGLRRVVNGVTGIVDDLPTWYRGADILLTTITDESRVVKEALVSGCDVLSPAFSTADIDESWLEWAAPEVGEQTTYFYGPKTPAESQAKVFVDGENAHPFWQPINTENTAQIGHAIERIWNERSKDVPKRRALLAEFARRRYDMRLTAQYAIRMYEEVMAEVGVAPIIGTQGLRQPELPLASG